MFNVINLTKMVKEYMFN